MKKIIVSLLWSLVTVCLWAQPTLQECRQLARNNYPEIRQHELIDKAEAYSLSNAAKAWLPQVSLGAQATLQNKVPGFPKQSNSMLEPYGISLPGLNKDQYKVSAEISQTIWDGGKTKADKELAKADAAQQRESTEVDLYALESRIDNLYFGIMLLDNNIDQTRAARTLLSSNLDKLNSLVKNGAAMQSDADAVEAELLSVGQTITQLEYSRESFRKMLEMFIGQPLGEGPLPEPQMQPQEWTEIGRPELADIEAAAKKIEAQKKLLDASVMPHVGLFAQGYYGYPGYDYFASMSSGKWTMNGIVGVKVSWNISSLYTRRNNLEKLKVAKDQLDVRKDVFLFNTNLQATQTNGEIERLRQVLRDDERIAELRKNVRVAAESKLKNGIIDTSDLLRKITDETNARLNLNNHEIELLKNIYELKHTVD